MSQPTEIESQILDLLRRKKKCIAQIDISHELRKSPSTISKYVAKLAGGGLVEIDDSEPPRKKVCLVKKAGDEK